MAYDLTPRRQKELDELISERMAEFFIDYNPEKKKTEEMIDYVLNGIDNVNEIKIVCFQVGRNFQNYCRTRAVLNMVNNIFGGDNKDLF